MASLASLLLSSGFFLAGSAFFYGYDTKRSGTTTAHLHLYMHDDYTGPCPTAMRVVSGRSLVSQAATNDANANATTPAKSTPRSFGDIVALNNALTEGPSRGSARVGFAMRVSEGGVVSDLSMHLALSTGEYSGSSLAVKGRIDTEQAERESIVVGGTGRFRLARGYMISRSYDYSLAKGGIVEMDLYVQHDD
ncbi:unnamed protein product [Alopecurus aequalis]